MSGGSDATWKILMKPIILWVNNKETGTLTNSDNNDSLGLGRFNYHYVKALSQTWCRSKPPLHYKYTPNVTEEKETMVFRIYCLRIIGTLHYYGVQ